MKLESKDVCVFMPCYNCEKYIKKTIESLLNQSYQGFDLVIVDDGSTDHSSDIVEKLASTDDRIILYKNEKNMGLGITRNLLFDYCKGYQYIAIMDADDLAPVDRLKIEYNYLNENPDVDCVSGVYQRIDEDGNYGEIVDDGVRSYEELKRTMVFRNPISNGSAMFRLEAVINNRIRYKDTFFCAQDYMFYCELVKTCKMVKLPNVLLYYRAYGDNLTARSCARKKERDKILDEIHEFTFNSGIIDFTPIEYRVFKRGYRDTLDKDFIFKAFFYMIRFWFKIKHPEYRRLM